MYVQYLSYKRNAADRRTTCAHDHENNMDDTGVVTNLMSLCSKGHGYEHNNGNKERWQVANVLITFEASSKVVLLTMDILIKIKIFKK